MPEARFEIFRDGSYFRFKMIDSNGDIVAQSPPQPDRTSCLEGIAVAQSISTAAKKNPSSPSNQIIDLTKDQDTRITGEARLELYNDGAGLYRFRLKGIDGETLIQGKGHPDRVTSLNEAYYVINNAQKAQIIPTAQEQITAPGEGPQSHGMGWILICRIVQSYRFRGMWWRDLITRDPKRRFPPRCR